MMLYRPVLRTLTVLLLLGLSESVLLAQPLPTPERYYMLIFAAQTTPRLPRYAHTFATLVKVCPGPTGGPPALQTYTISWLPATLHIRTLALHPEPGVNLNMHDTIQWSLSNNMKVYLWGPYEVHPLFAARFLQQYQWLTFGGQEQYKAINPERNRLISNCIHAISDLDPVLGRPGYPSELFGKSASRHITDALHRRGVIFGQEDNHCWLIPQLGLHCYPIRYMRYLGIRQCLFGTRTYGCDGCMP
jgi:hypothetical protein